MSFDVDSLYALLPAIYRVRDADEGQTPLKELLSVIAEQAAGLEESIAQLYDDQFIETGGPWTVPYIGDLVGYRSLDPQLQVPPGGARAEVANTIRLRRRKGTAAVLEELALDVTGWDAAVVEFFLRIATTQYLNHVRPDHLGAPDLRRVSDLETIGSPFDQVAHTTDVRSIVTRGGRHNIPNVGIFLWRVASRRRTDVDAYVVDQRRYVFDPLGADGALYTAAERSPDPSSLAGPLDVPLPITRRGLDAQLAALYGPGNSLSVEVAGQVLEIDEVQACDLSDLGPDPQTADWAHSGQVKVAIDPVLGRLMLPAGAAGPVHVTYYRGSPVDIGGGEYDRGQTLDAAPAPVRGVPDDRPSITDALHDLDGAGTVQVSANRTFAETPALSVAANERLVLRAADQTWPLLSLSGDLVVSGGDSGEVVLEGLLIAGGRIIVPAQIGGRPNQLQKLTIVHCTLVPGGELTRSGGPAAVTASIEVDAPDVELAIENSIVGAIRVAHESTASISGSIVDALDPENVAYEAPVTGTGGAVTVSAATLIGKLATAELTASNAILHGALGHGDTWVSPVVAERRQTGYLRYCYVPEGIQLPRRYQCVPGHGDTDEAPLVPRFESLRYDSPAYGLLHASCPAAIRCGGEDGSEMGVLHDLRAAQRVAGLAVRLDEYLRFGLEAGILFAS